MAPLATPLRLLLFFSLIKKYFVCFARLFAKLPRPADSEVTIAVFESSCHLLLPV